jgi:hypothetical protein
VHGHIEGNRSLVAERLDAVLAGLTAGPRTVLDLSQDVYGEPVTPSNASWLLGQTLCYLRHLEVLGQVAHEPDGEIEQWRAT